MDEIGVSWLPCEVLVVWGYPYMKYLEAPQNTYRQHFEAIVIYNIRVHGPSG